jgi:hypothetical protein
MYMYLYMYIINLQYILYVIEYMLNNVMYIYKSIWYVCFSVGVKCPPQAHVLKTWPQGWHYWDLVEPLGGGA